jgi:pimeloyl-ACP methyl ester carboxylesterase
MSLLGNYIAKRNLFIRSSGCTPLDLINKTYNHCMFYEDPNPSGKPAVVLLHGLGTDSTSWGFQVPALLSKGVRPIILDIPGFGKSSHTKGNWSIRGVAAEITHMLESELPAPVQLVGISMGGAIAIQIALDFPDCIERLVLVNTFAALRPRRLKDLSYLVIRFVRANLLGIQAQAEMVATRIFPEPDQEPLRKILIESILQSDPAVYRAAMRSLGMFDVKKRLAEIRIPTLVVTGALDNTVPPVVQAELAAKIPGSKQVFIPGGRHAVIADHPELFNQVLLEFLLG